MTMILVRLSICIACGGLRAGDGWKGRQSFRGRRKNRNQEVSEVTQPDLIYMVKGKKGWRSVGLIHADMRLGDQISEVMRSRLQEAGILAPLVYGETATCLKGHCHVSLYIRVAAPFLCTLILCSLTD